MSSIVATRYGSVEGERRRAHSAFLGIPYAKPPLGPLRFRAPEPPMPWSGVRPAKAFGAASIQGKVFGPGLLPENKPSEDCLYVNVFTPVADGKPRPVLFWIHGGAFTVGTAGTALYDGGVLAERHDVVVVTFNYRLGALGYLPLGEQGAAALGAVDNRGQHDQLAALAWTRENIAAFGGNPDDITIFGESAGGTSVYLLLAAPSAKGMFKRAILQSVYAPPSLRGADDFDESRLILLRSLGLKSSELGRLSEVSIGDLMSAQAKVEDKLPFPHYGPTFDADLYPRQPSVLLAEGEGSQVPVIVGSCRDEWNLFALADFNEWSVPLSDASLVEKVASKLAKTVRERAPSLVDTYRISRKTRGLPHDNRALLRAIEGDLRYRIPGLRFANLARTRNPDVRVYLFSFESPALGGMLGACHGLDLPFTFGSYDLPAQQRFVGVTPRVPELSGQVMRLWTSYARDGVPACEGVSRWPLYAQDRHATLEFAPTETRVVDDPYGEERAAWEGIL
ncbi:MAG: carboxylesterase family protein [Polyangiales bacterium]